MRATDEFDTHRMARLAAPAQAMDQYHLGDHAGFLVRPVASENRDDRLPLMFYSVRDLRPGHPA